MSRFPLLLSLFHCWLWCICYGFFFFLKPMQCYHLLLYFNQISVMFWFSCDVRLHQFFHQNGKFHAAGLRRASQQFSHWTSLTFAVTMHRHRLWFSNITNCHHIFISFHEYACLFFWARLLTKFIHSNKILLIGIRRHYNIK